jgi:ribonuclease T2
LNLTPEFGSDKPRSRAKSACSPPEKKEIVGAAPGTFDFYLLDLSWQPQFCARNPNGAGCGSHLGFIVHGLWPQDSNGNYPGCCSNDPAPASFGAAAGDMPGIPLAHEWLKHGTCTGLDGTTYFNDIDTVFKSVQLPASIGTQSPVARDAVLNQLTQANPTFPAGSIALSCSGNSLSDAKFCLDKTSMQPIACPGNSVASNCPTMIQVVAP